MCISIAMVIKIQAIRAYEIRLYIIIITTTTAVVTDTHLKSDHTSCCLISFQMRGTKKCFQQDNVRMIRK